DDRVARGCHGAGSGDDGGAGGGEPSGELYGAGDAAQIGRLVESRFVESFLVESRSESLRIRVVSRRVSRIVSLSKLSITGGSSGAVIGGTGVSVRVSSSSSTGGTITSAP